MLSETLIFIAGIVFLSWGLFRHANIFVIFASLLFIISAVGSFHTTEESLVVNDTIETIEHHYVNYPIAYASGGLFLLTIVLLVISFFETR